MDHIPFTYYIQLKDLPILLAQQSERTQGYLAFYGGDMTEERDRRRCGDLGRHCRRRYEGSMQICTIRKCRTQCAEVFLYNHPRVQSIKAHNVSHVHNGHSIAGSNGAAGGSTARRPGRDHNQRRVRSLENPSRGSATHDGTFSSLKTNFHCNQTVVGAWSRKWEAPGALWAPPSVFRACRWQAV